MKHINQFTIKEYMQFKEMLEDTEPDVFGIFELFGLDAIGMPFDIFQNNWRKIQLMTLSSDGVKKVYDIKGRRFKAKLNHLKLTAAQFIDFQTYMKDFKMEQVLSVFLIPMEKNWFKWTTKKYNTDYDILEVQQFLFNNMTMKEASDLSSFFLTSSNQLLKVMKASSEKKMYKMKVKQLKQKQVDLLG